jgi:2,4-dienoyl-CoA reductase-like NADH-dependent reductase (Old Yellow Enzyme family)
MTIDESGVASVVNRQSSIQLVVAHLFEPMTLRGVTFSHRVFTSPMCQYSSVDGYANDWHFVHLATRAVGGAAVVFTEATAVTPGGRISPDDLGIWSDHHCEMIERIVAFIHGQDTRAGMQLAHAGRKGSTLAPWKGRGLVAPADGGWQPVGPTDEPVAEGYPVPRALATDDVPEIVAAFREAARRARDAGMDVVEIHAARGYLIHEFLSPLTNRRSDRYGGSFENRIRLCVEIVDAVRSVWPDRLPLFVRISATDWVPGGWDLDQTVALCRRLRERGVDLIDCSSGGNVPDVHVPLGPGYQTPFAERIRRDAQVATAAVGLITSPVQADHIVRSGQADGVVLARELLRDPYWPLRAARELGHHVPWPPQYLRAAPAAAPPRPSPAAKG